MTKSRKRTSIGFGAAVFFVLLTSTAYACTVWVGQFSVERDSNSDGDVLDAYEKVTTYGLGTGMNHCAMKGAVKLHMGNGSHSPSTVTLRYQALPSPLPTGCATAVTTAPNDNTYAISYLNTGFGDFVGGNSGNWTIDGGNVLREYKADCMATGGHGSRWIDANDELVVTSGSGSEVTVIDAKPNTINSGNEIPDLPGTESAICVQEKSGYTGAPHGGQAPVIVI